MLTPTRARKAALYLPLITVALLGACSGEVLAPSAGPRIIEATSAFVPSAAAKALIGVADGTYTLTLDPTRDQTFSLGANQLSMPANSVCDLLTSGYGVEYWNRSCTPHTRPITLMVTIRNAASQYPSIEFEPAMRFNPSKSVQLFMYAPQVSAAEGKHWLMAHCSNAGACADDSGSDAAVATRVDYNANVLFRRVKHFSGYTVAERDSTAQILSRVTTTTTTTTTTTKKRP